MVSREDGSFLLTIDKGGMFTKWVLIEMPGQASTQKY